jgi:hypothetical protein
LSNRTRSCALAVALAVSALLVSAGSASAFSQIKIRSLFLGPSNSTAFVELQMTADGQNDISGNRVNIWDATMGGGSAYTLLVDPPNGQNQRMILLRDAGSALPADFYLTNLGQTLSNWSSGGLMCWETFDCVAWGNFTGSSPPSPVGTPIVGGLSSSQVSVRRIDRACPTLLEGADDTNDSNADFGFAVGYPVRTNADTPTEVPCPTSNPPGQPNPSSGALPPGQRKKKCRSKGKHKGFASPAAGKKKRCGNKHK